jgi:hypothetical protein
LNEISQKKSNFLTESEKTSFEISLRAFMLNNFAPVKLLYVFPATDFFLFPTSLSINNLTVRKMPKTNYFVHLLQGWPTRPKLVLKFSEFSYILGVFVQFWSECGQKKSIFLAIFSNAANGPIWVGHP